MMQLRKRTDNRQMAIRIVKIKLGKLGDQKIGIGDHEQLS